MAKKKFYQKPKFWIIAAFPIGYAIGFAIDFVKFISAITQGGL